MGVSNGNRGGKPTVIGARVTREQAEEFDRKRQHLTRSEAARLALLQWPGLEPRPTDV